MAGIGLASAVPKIIAGFSQRAQARRLKLADTTTAGEREQLAMSRQMAGSAVMPGMGAMQGRLGMVQAGAVQNARLGAASGADFLAAAGAADARRQQGEMHLGIQGQQFQQQSQMQLRRDLGVQSQRQQRDLDTYNNTKAALIEGSARNLDAGVQTLGSYAAAGLNMGAGSGAGAAAGGGPGMRGLGQYGNVGYMPGEEYGPSNLGLGMGRFRPGRQRGIGVANYYR